MRASHIFCLVFTAFIGLAAQMAAAADGCAGQTDQIIKLAYPGAENTAQREYRRGDLVISIMTDDAELSIYNMICHVWPAYPDLTLVAVLLMREINNEINGGDLELLVLDTNSKKIRQRLLLNDGFQPDTTGIINLAFDTARYQLSQSKMAFGLRMLRESSYETNAFSETRLWLFTINGPELRIILPDALVQRSLTRRNGDCTGIYTDLNRTLEMSKDSHNGIADIIVTGRKTAYQEYEGSDNGCHQLTLIKEKSKATLISDDGISYLYPQNAGNW